MLLELAQPREARPEKRINLQLSLLHKRLLGLLGSGLLILILSSCTPQPAVADTTDHRIAAFCDHYINYSGIDPSLLPPDQIRTLKTNCRTQLSTVSPDGIPDIVSPGADNTKAVLLSMCKQLLAQNPPACQNTLFAKLAQALTP